LGSSLLLSSSGRPQSPMYHSPRKSPYKYQPPVRQDATRGPPHMELIHQGKA
jgi:hypothetical protein